MGGAGSTKYGNLHAAACCPGSILNPAFPPAKPAHGERGSASNGSRTGTLSGSKRRTLRVSM
jgi:hypothetical protein